MEVVTVSKVAKTPIKQFSNSSTSRNPISSGSKSSEEGMSINNSTSSAEKEPSEANSSNSCATENKSEISFNSNSSTFKSGAEQLLIKYKNIEDKWGESDGAKSFEKTLPNYISCGIEAKDRSLQNENLKMPNTTSNSTDYPEYKDQVDHHNQYMKDAI